MQICNVGVHRHNELVVCNSGANCADVICVPTNIFTFTNNNCWLIQNSYLAQQLFFSATFVLYVIPYPFRLLTFSPL
jgi:hypothetical protein